MEGFEDLTAMRDLTEQSILNNIKNRYVKDNIYTSVGPVLLSVNPYHIVHDSLHAPLRDLGQRAFQQLLDSRQSQSILISGEAGSGKTEVAKRLLKNFCGKENNKLAESITATIPLFETLGCATTVANYNSSRFGKLTKIYYDTAGTILGASVSVFLLEKPRVVSQLAGERNFHAFYALIKGASQDDRRQYSLLGSPADYNYLTNGDLPIKDVNDAVNFDAFRQSLRLLEFSEEQIASVFKILSAILLLGNLEFGGKLSGRPVLDNKAEVKILNLNVLDTIVELLGNPRDLRGTLETKSVLSPNRMTTNIVSLPKGEALENRDALAKNLYSGLMDWLATTINEKLKPKTDAPCLFIGVLDLYGFENGAKNSLEQLCINYANEKLQQQYHNHYFTAEQNDYAENGLPWTKIDASAQNNQACTVLMEQLFQSLDDACRTTQTSTQTDLEFAMVISKQLAIYPHLYASDRIKKDVFKITHFADQVTYNANGFLAKNVDKLNPTVVTSIKQSQDSVVENLPFGGDGLTSSDSTPTRLQRPGVRNVAQKQRTTCQRYKSELATLIETVDATDVYFVRCHVPNSERLPYKFDDARVAKQLKYNSIPELVKLRQAGYGHRLTTEIFFKNFLHLLPKGATIYSITDDLLKIPSIEQHMYAVGSRKVFLKDQAYATLSRLNISKSVLVIQSFIRKKQAEYKMAFFARGGTLPTATTQPTPQPAQQVSSPVVAGGNATTANTNSTSSTTGATTAKTPRSPRTLKTSDPSAPTSARQHSPKGLVGSSSGSSLRSQQQARYEGEHGNAPRKLLTMTQSVTILQSFVRQQMAAKVLAQIEAEERGNTSPKSKPGESSVSDFPVTKIATPSSPAPTLPNSSPLHSPHATQSPSTGSSTSEVRTSKSSGEVSGHVKKSPSSSSVRMPSLPSNPSSPDSPTSSDPALKSPKSSGRLDQGGSTSPRPRREKSTREHRRKDSRKDLGDATQSEISYSESERSESERSHSERSRSGRDKVTSSTSDASRRKVDRTASAKSGSSSSSKRAESKRTLNSDSPSSIPSTRPTLERSESVMIKFDLSKLDSSVIGTGATKEAVPTGLFAIVFPDSLDKKIVPYQATVEVRTLLTKKLTNLGLNIDNYYVVDQDGTLLRTETLCSDLTDRRVFVLEKSKHVGKAQEPKPKERKKDRAATVTNAGSSKDALAALQTSGGSSSGMKNSSSGTHIQTADEKLNAVTADYLSVRPMAMRNEEIPRTRPFSSLTVTTLVGEKIERATRTTPWTAEDFQVKFNQAASSCSSNLAGLWGIHPVVLAKQLTFLDQQLFASIQSWELFDGRWSKPILSPNLTKLTTQFNRTCIGLITELVTSKSRVELRFMLRSTFETMEQLFLLNNMQSLVAFVAALQSPPLQRLEDLQPYLELLDKYLDLSFHSPSSGFKNMRAHINHVQQQDPSLVCLPFIGMLQKDLLGVSEKKSEPAQSSFTQETLEFLTFLSKLTHSLSVKTEASIVPDPYMQKLFKIFWELDDELLLECSKEIESVLETAKRSPRAHNSERATDNEEFIKDARRGTAFDLISPFKELSPLKKTNKHDKEHSRDKHARGNDSRQKREIVREKKVEETTHLARLLSQKRDYYHDIYPTIVALITRDLFIEQTEDDCTLQSQEGPVPYSLNLLEARCPAIAKNLAKFNERRLPMRILKPLLDYICLDYLILNALDIDDLFAVWKVAIDFDMYHLSGLIYIYSNAHQTRENCFGYAKAWKKWNIDYAYYQTVSFIQEHFETMEREFTESPELASSILMTQMEDIKPKIPEVKSSTLVTDFHAMSSRKIYNITFSVTDIFGVPSNYKVNKTLLCHNSTFFEKVSQETWIKFSTVQKNTVNIAMPHASIEVLLKLILNHGYYQCTQGIDIVSVLYLYELGESLGLVNWPAIEEYLKQRITNILSTERMEISQHILSLNTKGSSRPFEAILSRVAQDLPASHLVATGSQTNADSPGDEPANKSNTKGAEDEETKVNAFVQQYMTKDQERQALTDKLSKLEEEVEVLKNSINAYSC